MYDVCMYVSDHVSSFTIGFGIMDNAILIVAGDAIDTSLGVVLGISTMCAAAIGNIISDVAGIMLGTVVEDFCAKYIPLRIPVLTHTQRQLRSVRMANQVGCGVGIVIGCIIGMFPLLFIDSNKIQHLKREAAMDAIFEDVMEEAGSLIGAQRMCLYLKVQKSNEPGKTPVPTPVGHYLYAKYDDHQDPSPQQKHTSKLPPQEQLIPLGRGIVSRAALTGEAWNIYDVRTEPDYTPEVGYRNDDDNDDNDNESNSNADGKKRTDPIRNMLCVPVLDHRGRSLAVIQAINKIQPDHPAGGKAEDESQTESTVAPTKPTQRGFTTYDVQVLKALASHIGVALQRMYDSEGEDAELRLKDTIQMLKEYGLAALADEASFSNRQPLFPDTD
jgi:GAF domain-containing protein